MAVRRRLGADRPQRLTERDASLPGAGCLHRDRDRLRRAEPTGDRLVLAGGAWCDRHRRDPLVDARAVGGVITN